jgi:hydrogen peroxide-dependent heme synthase
MGDEARAIPSQGWGVLHLYYGIRGDRNEPVSVRDAVALVEAFERDPDQQVIPFSVVGQRADLGWMVIGPDFVELQRLQRSLEATALGARLEARPELSFVSITEASEYLGDDGSERVRAMRDARMHPRDLPLKRMICFYPMSKRRGAEHNWYRLEFEERKRLMHGHGAVGRSFSGRILQLITAATGLSDWEWGVTLLADDPKAIKDVVYEMRYDEGSAIYGEFGPFTLGLVAPLAQAVRDAGQAVIE